MIGTIEPGSFTVEPTNPERRCTITSVAAHTLYEKSHPYLLPGPGGILDLSDAVFAQETDRRVRVTGARDPLFIGALDEIVAGVRRDIAQAFGDDYRLLFRVYGRDGVMGSREPTPASGHEVGILIEAIADDPELADTICAAARAGLLHAGYSGRVSTAGNLAFPFSPSDLRAGPVYTFSLHHLIDVDDPRGLFPLELHEVGS